VNWTLNASYHLTLSRRQFGVIRSIVLADRDSRGKGTDVVSYK
jgi:hypothetical protein